MPEEICPHCDERFEVFDAQERQEATRRDLDGRVWRSVISRNWLAHRCELPAPTD